jgi:NADPH-dependent 2,4-dienoyl-CoA reductase/sulfur reductase-like enzyme
VRAEHVIVATGAMERPVPVPGWTLPGVMTAGALQILLKSSGVLPEGRVVLAGCGPLLWLLGRQMVAAGRPPAAVVETVPPGRSVRLWRDLARAAPAAATVAKGLSMIRAVRAAKVPVFRGAHDIRIEGEGGAEAIIFTAGGRARRIPADVVALHQGVVPNQQITRAIGARHAWVPEQAAFWPVRDDWLSLDVDGFSVAGDGGGIGGAEAAALEGRLAALGAAHRLGRLDEAGRDRAARPVRRALRRETALRPFLDRLYTPPRETVRPADTVVVCRCEEVTAGAVREAVRLGAAGPNQAKSFLRCGMGPCQGRLCGLTVTSLVAAERGVSEEEAGYFRIRPPLKPVTLSELASLAEDPSERAA